MISDADMMFYDEPIFPEEEHGGRRRLDYFGYTFPPLQREMRRRMHHHLRAAHPAVQWYVPRILGDDPYADLQESENPEDMPALISDIGLGKFARRSFIARWRDSGVFETSPQVLTRPEFVDAQFADPSGLFHVYGAGSWVILADLARLGRRPLPRCWADLLHPRYRRDIVGNGAGGALSPLLLFNFYRDFGLDGLEALGRNLRDAWGGAQMARMAGTDNPDGAALYILPYFWAVNNIHPDSTTLVWPAEGAYSTPLLLLRKRGENAAAALVRDFLLGRHWAETMEGVRCTCARDDIAVSPLPGKLRWLEWERVHAWNLAEMRPALEAALKKGMQA